MPMTGPADLDRRTLLGGVATAGCAAVAGLGALVWPRAAVATQADMEAAILQDFGHLDMPEGDLEIEMPAYSDSGKSVPLSLAVPCTMTGLDYPEVVALYAARNPRPRIGRIHFTPACGSARVSTRIRIDSYQDVVAVVRMASGEVFRGTRKVDVTYGACEDEVANDQFPPGWAPRTRVAVPASVAAGSIIEVRTIIGHPMETGLRHDQTGLPVPVRIAERFSCRMDGTEVFAVDLEPAISANPYFAFDLRVDRSCRLDFQWIDTTQDVYSDQASITVL